ncbi:MAG: universal stress protein, partial [Ramlibacter sp.]|nr:universal stress protein [Ramlibacter sp.]
ANIEVQTTEIGIVDSLLARAAELKTDLVVMGAYSHRPSSGYTTRALLSAITVSVLTSH